MNGVRALPVRGSADSHPATAAMWGAPGRKSLFQSLFTLSHAAARAKHAHEIARRAERAWCNCGVRRSALNEIM